MSTTEFSPERSAAIRQLLIDTVEDEPRRRRRLQILLTSVLSGVAVALAGGAAALALSGIIHLGGGETPPAPAPTPTPTTTVTPTPTPTPTPTATPRPLVQSAPVLPHDVDTLRDTQRWALDLPGDPECTLMNSYTLSDARAVYVSGLRPAEDDRPECFDRPANDLGVTLVDTSNGQILWQREWTFTPENVAFGTGFAVLGTSGRAVFATSEAGVGPHDVLDLETGHTVGTFKPDWADFSPARDMQPVPGDSGDIIVAQHFTVDGKAVRDDVVTRADPADFEHPEWSVSVGLQGSSLGPVSTDGTAMPLSGLAVSSDSYKTVMLDLRTGSTSAPMDNTGILPMSQILWGTSGSQLIAYGEGGQALWSRPLAQGSYISAAESPGTLPGFPNDDRTNDTGELFVIDQTTVTLIDQTTGDVRWSVPKPDCVKGYYMRPELDVRRDAFLLPSGQAMCAVSHATGESVDAPALPSDFVLGPFGLTHRYTYTPGPDDPGSAYDLQTGNRLWTRDRHDYDYWSFDGGYLVSRHGNHVESIG